MQICAIQRCDDCGLDGAADAYVIAHAPPNSDPTCANATQPQSGADDICFILHSAAADPVARTNPSAAHSFAKHFNSGAI